MIVQDLIDLEAGKLFSGKKGISNYMHMYFPDFKEFQNLEVLPKDKSTIESNKSMISHNSEIATNDWCQASIREFNKYRISLGETFCFSLPSIESRYRINQPGFQLYFAYKCLAYEQSTARIVWFLTSAYNSPKSADGLDEIDLYREKIKIL